MYSIVVPYSEVETKGKNFQKWTILAVGRFQLVLLLKRNIVKFENILLGGLRLANWETFYVLLLYEEFSHFL